MCMIEDAEETESFWSQCLSAVACAFFRSQHDIYNKFKSSCVRICMCNANQDEKLIEIHARVGVRKFSSTRQFFFFIYFKNVTKKKKTNLYGVINLFLTMICDVDIYLMNVIH